MTKRTSASSIPNDLSLQYLIAEVRDGWRELSLSQWIFFFLYIWYWFFFKILLEYNWFTVLYSWNWELTQCCKSLIFNSRNPCSPSALCKGLSHEEEFCGTEEWPGHLSGWCLVCGFCRMGAGAGITDLMGEQSHRAGMGFIPHRQA